MKKTGKTTRLAAEVASAPGTVAPVHGVTETGATGKAGVGVQIGGEAAGVRGEIGIGTVRTDGGEVEAGSGGTGVGAEGEQRDEAGVVAGSATEEHQAGAEARIGEEKGVAVRGGAGTEREGRAGAKAGTSVGKGVGALGRRPPKKTREAAALGRTETSEAKVRSEVAVEEMATTKRLKIQRLRSAAKTMRAECRKKTVQRRNQRTRVGKARSQKAKCHLQMLREFRARHLSQVLTPWHLHLSSLLGMMALRLVLRQPPRWQWLVLIRPLQPSPDFHSLRQGILLQPPRCSPKRRQLWLPRPFRGRRCSLQMELLLLRLLLCLRRRNRKPRSRQPRRLETTVYLWSLPTILSSKAVEAARLPIVANLTRPRMAGSPTLKIEVRALQDTGR